LTPDPLDTWVGLNAVVPRLDEAACLALLTREREGRKRITFLLRVHSRLNKVRADRERAELMELARHG